MDAWQHRWGIRPFGARDNRPFVAPTVRESPLWRDPGPASLTARLRQWRTSTVSLSGLTGLAAGQRP